MRSMVLDMIIFCVGFGLHCLMSAGTAVKGKGYKSISYWAYVHWDSILVRWVLSCGLWSLYIEHASVVTGWLGTVGIGIGHVQIPIDSCTSLFVGYLMDSLLDLIAIKVPWLQHELPIDFDDPSTVKGIQDAKPAGHTEATKGSS